MHPKHFHKQFYCTVSILSLIRKASLATLQLLSIDMAASSALLAPGGVVPQGPFGGSSGSHYYDGVGDIVKVTVTYSDKAVWSLQTVYRQTTDDPVFTTQQHGTKGPQTAVFELDCPNERLLQVKGTISTLKDPKNHAHIVGDEAAAVDDVVSSITFVTTKKSYGPYGAPKGRQFQSSPLGKVVGFFGRAGSYINSIGTFTDFSNSDTNLVPDGPWGSSKPGGSIFYDGRADKIKQIDVVYDDVIISLNVKYDQGTKGFLSSMHGGAGGAGGPQGTKVPIVFEEDEYLAQVTGAYGLKDDDIVVTSLSFVSNKTTYGPYGYESATSFESRPGSQILGFYGRADWRVNQIGVFTATAPPPPVALSGGFGGNGGSPWYDGRGEISGITVNYGRDEFIGQIQVTYLQGDQQFVAPLHGAKQLKYTDKIPLNFPDEYLVQVKGTYGKASGVQDLVLSLQFITNKKTYGPFGNDKDGTPFETAPFEPAGTRIVGLFGRSGGLLDQIGAIVAPAPSRSV